MLNCIQSNRITVPMKLSPPPPVLDSARVVAYAYVDDIAYRRCGKLFVDGILLEKVPRLAVALNLGMDLGAMLLHCDSDWNVLGVSGTPTVAATKTKAEENYPGVGARWIDIDTSVDAALAFYDAQHNNAKCSFCGKRPFEVESLVKGHGANICERCIDQFHGELHKPD